LGELLEQQYAPRPAGGNNNTAGGATPGGDPTLESTPAPESTPTPPGTPGPASSFSIQLLNPGQCHSGRAQRAKNLCLGRRKQNLLRSLRSPRMTGFNIPAMKKVGRQGTPWCRPVQVSRGLQMQTAALPPDLRKTSCFPGQRLHIITPADREGSAFGVSEDQVWSQDPPPERQAFPQVRRPSRRSASRTPVSGPPKLDEEIRQPAENKGPNSAEPSQIRQRAENKRFKVRTLI
jgi:hypothetical protein